MRIALVQLAMTSDPAENLEQALQAADSAARGGAEVICLPELFMSRYFCQTEDAANFKLAESVPGPTTERFEQVARRHDVVVVLSLFERRARGVYHNTAAVIDGKAGFLGKYRKMHIPDDPRYYEKFYFTPGDLGFRAFDTRAGRIGVLICWDQWFPEAARLTALKGADVLFYPTAIGWHPEERQQFGDAQRAAWQTIQRSHAVANGCYVVAVNRTGFEPDPRGADEEGICFWGGSFAAAPDGSVVTMLPEGEAATEIVDADLDLIDEARQGWPFFRDRRIDAYGPLLDRFGTDG